MADHSYDDAPLWTVLSTLATLTDVNIRVVDLARQVRTASGWEGAYRVIGRLLASGYAVIEGGEAAPLSTSEGRRATIRLTPTGLTRFRAGAGWVGVDQVHRINTSGGFGVVHRRRWMPGPGKTA